MRIVYICLFLVLPNSWGNINLVKCQRETPKFKQFCQVQQEEIPIQLKIDNYLKEIGQKVDMAKVINSRNSLNLPKGLIPHLKFTLNWTDSKTCWKSDLRTDKTYVVINGKKIGRVFVGYSDYSFPLMQENNKRFWQINQSTYSLNFKVVDYLMEGKPVPATRIPNECNMIISNIRIGFDPTDLDQNIAKSENDLKLLTALLLKSTLLHSSLVENDKGVKCYLYHLVNTLKKVEFLDESDSLEKLSMRSKKAVMSMMEEAHNLNAVDGVMGVDYFTYFASHSFQDELKDLCEDSSSLDYQISTKPFIMADGSIVRQQGYQNAILFNKSRQQLQDEVELACVYFLLKRHEVKQFKFMDWLLNPLVKSYLN